MSSIINDTPKMTQKSFPQFQNAVSLYERKGFRHLESRLGSSGHTATTIHMIKDI